AVVIHQDFKHYYTSYIHVLQYRLRGHFRYDGAATEGSTVAFRVARPIAVADAARAADFDAVADEEIDEAFEHSFSLIAPDRSPNVAAAHVMAYVHERRPDRARATYARYAAEGMGQAGEMEIVADKYLKPESASAAPHPIPSP